MRLLTTDALLLDVVDLHDRDRIVTYLTREYGKKRGVAQGARRKYSRFAGELQPLAKVQVTWFEKENRDLVRIRGVELLRSAHRFQEDLDDLLLGSYLADHILEFAQENEASENLFRLLDSTLEALLAGCSRDLAARYFETWVLRLAGIFPVPKECPQCGRPFGVEGAVLPANGDALLCPACALSTGGAGGLRVGPSVLEFLRSTARRSLARMAERMAEGEVLRQVERLTGRLRRRFLHRELRSYEVLQGIGAGHGLPGS